MQKDKEPNALLNESSPYLQQHAYNPVKWLPWGDVARQKAISENKPMLVSIGYSSCHWCHVMERESFENDSVAEIMNAQFVCVKVDREERPDVDQVHMEAVQMMRQQGGWPLNCFTTPDGKPIYGGTYFPVEQWKSVLNQIAKLWSEDPDKVIEYGDKLVEGMGVSGALPIDLEDDFNGPEILKASTENWSERFDIIHGGPNKAPKFPLPCNYLFLLHYISHTKNAALEKHFFLTLDKMAQGGIYDQVGGGFTRYSTDIYWKVPHFEKMLYDNAQLLGLYSEAYAYSGKQEYLEITKGIKTWLAREMKHESESYFSAIDADSEGVEGKFYVWSKDELANFNWEAYSKFYQTNQAAIWEGNFIPLRNGEPDSYEDFKEFNTQLLELRNERERPITDDKQLCSWNAMLATGFFKSGRYTHCPEDFSKGQEILDFIFAALYDQDSGDLFHSWKNGEHNKIGFLEDYAFTIEALIEAYQATFSEEHLFKAKDLCNIALDRFYDQKKGVFFFTAETQSDLITRPMELSDNVIPSSNAVMAHNLSKLASYFDLPHFEGIAERLLNAVRKGMIDYAEGYAHWADLLLQKTLGYPEVVISGEKCDTLVNQLREKYDPCLIWAASKGKTNIPLLKSRFKDGQTLGYICRGKSCLKPSSDILELRLELEGLSRSLYG